MNIDIKGLSKEQLVDLQSQIEKQLTKNKLPPKGTICECWDDDDSKMLAYANGEGRFMLDINSASSFEYNNYRVVEQGLVFSDEIITYKDFTENMDKQLCLCWDAENMPVIRAIDYKNKYAFSSSMERNGMNWNNYRLCTTPYESMPQWAKDMIDKLED